MSIKVDYFRESFILGVESFKKVFAPEDHGKPFCGESSHTVLKQQVIPTIYLERTNNINFNGGEKASTVRFTETNEEISDVVAFPGSGLRILSASKNIVVGFEKFNNILATYYSPKDCYYYFFLSIERKDVLSFTKVKPVKFYGLNAKNSTEIQHNTRRGRRGIIGHLLVSGVTTLTSKLEDDLKLSEGILFELSFLKENQEEKINIVCELSYSNRFEDFLTKNWTKDVPEIVLKPKGGCFIATATMGNHNHPIVVDLRNFRDTWLIRQKWGISFIDWYYKHSPRAAKLIERSRLLKSISYLVIIKPLQIITKKLR